MRARRGRRGARAHRSRSLTLTLPARCGWLTHPSYGIGGGTPASLPTRRMDARTVHTHAPRRLACVSGGGGGGGVRSPVHGSIRRRKGGTSHCRREGAAKHAGRRSGARRGRCAGQGDPGRQGAETRGCSAGRRAHRPKAQRALTERCRVDHYVVSTNLLRRKGFSANQRVNVA